MKNFIKVTVESREPIMSGQFQVHAIINVQQIVEYNQNQPRLTDIFLSNGVHYLVNHDESEIEDFIKESQNKSR